MLNLTLSEEERLEEILQHIKEKSEAEEVHLITKAGVIIATTAGNEDKTTVAALLAGNVSANEAINKLKGDKELKHIASESEDEGIYMEMVGDELIIAVFYKMRKTRMGTVKFWVRKWKGEIEKIIENAKNREPEIDISDINLQIGDLFN